MIRAVVKDKQGHVTRGPFNFPTQDLFEDFKSNFESSPSRFREQVVIVDSNLSFEEATLLDALQALAMNANGYLKRFVIDGDMHRRLKDRKLEQGDINLLQEVLATAADTYRVLAGKERAGT